MKLLHGDNVAMLRKHIADGSIDLTVTSPPYDNMRAYEGFSWDFESLAKELYRVTKNGGVVVWVVGDATIKGSETGTSFRQALFFMQCGFNLHDTMIYQKSQACFGSNKAYLQSFEYMFVLSKGVPKKTNLIRDRANVRGGVTESTVSSGRDENGISGERVLKTAEILGKRKNIWQYGVGGGKFDHPAVFPEQLARDHVVSWSNEGDTVLDPFMGSGTTGAACAKTNRKFVGVELSEKYFAIAQRRIAEASMGDLL